MAKVPSRARIGVGNAPLSCLGMPTVAGNH
jgi:hypothetical protein